MGRTLTTSLIKLSGDMKTTCLTYASFNRGAELRAYLKASAQAGIISSQGESLLIAYFETKARQLKLEG